MDSLSGRLHYILMLAQGIDLHGPKAEIGIKNLCKELRKLEHEAELMQMSPGLPSFESCSPD